MNIYLGTYIKLEDEKIKDREEVEMRTCPNTDCANHKQTLVGNFCNKCGSEITDTMVEYEGETTVECLLCCDTELFQSYTMSEYYGKVIVSDNSIAESCGDGFDQPITEIPDLSNLSGDPKWKPMCDKLDELGVKYKFHYGVVGLDW